MSIARGTRFTSYEFAECIGVGGMGEVYRATDLKLKREVAIKVLPDSLSQDAERLARFQREAEILASLNHANIAQIFGLEQADGITALVMELIEGPTLAERIEEGPIAVDEALGIAMQIAEALEAAHERGIVHRDLKPANIKLRPDGLVKVLDFGIAKAMDNHANHSSGSHSPALTTPAMTEAGIVLGTAAYMSPEQARGKKVDQRADIWAFGCVLYEMLTGQPAFGAEDVTTTLARILERSADLNALPHSLSPAVRHTLKLCLEKDVRKRVADIRDVKLALNGTFETGTVLNAEAVAALVARGRLVWMSAFAVSLVLIAAMAFPTLQYLREETPLPPPRPPESRVDIVTPATEFPSDFALSPDGSHIVFVAEEEGGGSSLWLRSLAATTAQPIFGTEEARTHFWSPDGRSIAFFTGSGLKRVDIGGGAPRNLATFGGLRGGTWGADNTLLFPTGPSSPLVRMSAAGGATSPVTTLAPGHSAHTEPYFLPDGLRFVFYVLGSPDVRGIYLGHLDGREPVRLTAADSAGVFHPDGWLLWNREGTLSAQRLDLTQAVLTGEPIALADGVVGNASVTSAGVIAYRTGSSRARQLTWFDRTGSILSTIGEFESSLSNPRLSPDGRLVTGHRSLPGNVNVFDIWLLDGARSSRFTFDPAADTFPLWSPDGNRIVFRSDRTGGGDLYQKSSSGAGEETLLISSGQLKTPNSWSADGRFLMYHSISPETARDLWAVPMTGDLEPFVVLQTRFNEQGANFSPDGRWIAYTSDESGRYEVYVRAFIAPEGSTAAAVGNQWQVSIAGGTSAAWSPDGQEIYYLDPAGNMVAASFTANADIAEIGVPVVLFPRRMGSDTSIGRQYDVAADGRFLINTLLGEGGNDPIRLIQNWNPEAEQ